MNSEKIVKEIGISQFISENGAFSQTNYSLGCGDGSYLEDIFHDKCLMKMIHWEEDDCTYKALDQFDGGESDVSRVEVWQAGAFVGWLKNCTCCGRMVRRDKHHISVEKNVLEESEFSNAQTTLSNQEVLLFCSKECLLKSLDQESSVLEFILECVSEWEGK